MKIIALFVKQSLRNFFFAVLAGTISGLCLSGMIYLIHHGINTGLEDLGFLTALFFGAWIGYGITSFLAAYLVTGLSQDVILGLRVDISKKIMKASFSSMERKTHQLLAIFTEDISTIYQGVYRLPNILTSITMVMGCFAYMIYISWQLFVIFLVIFAVAYSFFKRPINNFRSKVAKSRNTYDDLMAHFQALVFGLKELLLNQGLRKNFVENVLLPSCEDQKKYNLWSTVWITGFFRSAEMLILLGFASMLVLIAKYEIVSFEVLTQFLMIALFTLSPMANISSFFPFLEKMNVALGKVNEAGIMLENAAINRSEARIEKQLAVGETYISLKDVTYRYYHESEDKLFELGPINLQIQKGELIYLLGGNGSGKSTLAKIICGLYLPESGSVEMAGVSVQEKYLDDYRENFDAIFTDFFLFEELDHIQSEDLKSDVERYLKLLELDKKVKIKDNKLSTTALSTGQRQRLALLMAYLDDKPFYIFDEWAASQDPYYKEVFYRNLLPELKAKGKTLLVITHDEKYFDGADRFVMLQEGKMIDLESHEDLLAIYSQGVSD